MVLAAWQRSELKSLLRLSGSMALIQVGYHLMGLVDTAIAGRVGGETLAATGLGSAVFFAVSVIGVGLMLGLDPLVSQALGGGQAERARHVLLQGLYLALVASVPMTLFVLGIGRLLPLMGIAPSLAAQTNDYLVGRVPSLFLLLACIAIRSYLQAGHRTRPVVVAVILFNLVNFVADWILLFGDKGLNDFGIPALGLKSMGAGGLGWASSLATLGQAIFMGLYALRGDVPNRGASQWRPSGTAMWQVTKVGLPLGLQLGAETGVFALVSVLMGRMGTESMAGHQVALQIASFTYAATLGIGAATSVQVGRAIGRQDAAATRFAGLAGISLGAVYMVGNALLMWWFPETLARLMTSDATVIPSAVTLITIAAVFQVADGVQSVASGALRGAGVTRFSFVANVLGHWLVGVPVGALFGYGLGWGAPGLWWGLTAGLAAVALSLGLKFESLSRKPVARLQENAS